MTSLSNYPNGFPNGVTIRGIPILNIYTGDIWWVDSVYGSNINDGTFEHPKASIAYLYDNAIVGAGDIVICKPGHVETVIAAAGLDLDVASTCIVFLGQGSNRAYITFTTAVTADMDIDAANITMVNPKFIAGIDALTGPIDVNAADFCIINGEWHDGTSIDTTDCIVGDANADRCVIDGWKYFKGDQGGTQKESHIQFGAASEVVLKNIYISGSFNEANVEFTAAGVDVQFENMYLTTTDADPSPAMVLHANTTGFAKNVKLRIASGTTYTSNVAKIQWASDCEGFNTDGYGGDPIGTAVATGVEGLITSVGTQASAAAANILSIMTSTASQATSVGTGTSVINSQAISIATGTVSVGAQVLSAATSIGTGTSVINSQAISVATGVVSVGAQVLSAATSVGTGTSVINSQVASVGTEVSYFDSILTSKIASLGLIISLINSKTV